MAILKSIAALAACGAATVHAAAVQPRDYKTQVTSVGNASISHGVTLTMTIESSHRHLGH